MACGLKALGLLLLSLPLDAVLLQENTLSNARVEKMRAAAVKTINKNLDDIINAQNSGTFKARSVAKVEDVSGIMERADRYLHEKRRTLTKFNGTRAAEKCGVPCIAASIIDGFYIARRVLNKNSCTSLNIATWWVVGIVAMMTDQGLSFDEAIFALAQQLTTVGYGSHYPTTNGMKIFHALHAVVGVTMITDPTYQIIDKWLGKYLVKFGGQLGEGDNLQFIAAKFVPLVLTIIGSTFGWAQDLHMQDTSVYPTYGDALLDAFYLTLITFTTVGYGDINPGTVVGRYIAVPWQIIGTNLFLNSFLDRKELEKKASEPYSHFEKMCHMTNKIKSVARTQRESMFSKPALPSDESQGHPSSPGLVDNKLHGMSNGGGGS